MQRGSSVSCWTALVLSLVAHFPRGTPSTHPSSTRSSTKLVISLWAFLLLCWLAWIPMIKCDILCIQWRPGRP